VKQKKDISEENQMKVGGICCARDTRQKEYRCMKYFAEKKKIEGIGE